MNAAAMLKRIEVPEVKPEPVQSSACDILARAKEVLHYEPIVRSERQRAGDLLRTTLRRLDIHPFSPESVRKYKARKARSESGLYMSVGLAAACALAALAAMVLLVIFSDDTGWSAVVLGAGVLVGLVAGVCGCVAMCQRAMSDLDRANWIDYEIGSEERKLVTSDDSVGPGAVVTVSGLRWPMFIEKQSYDRPMPLFAVETALRIKEALPAATLLVNELHVTPRNEHRRMQRMARDPFLVVTHGDYTAFVEVWNEPSFNGRREA